MENQKKNNVITDDKITNRGSRFYQELKRQLVNIVNINLYKVKIKYRYLIDDEQNKRVRYRVIIEPYDESICTVTFDSISRGINNTFRDFNVEIIDNIAGSINNGIINDNNIAKTFFDLDIVVDDTINYSIKECEEYVKRLSGVFNILNSRNTENKLLFLEMDASKFANKDNLINTMRKMKLIAKRGDNIKLIE